MSEEAINWSADSMLEVTIKQPDDFLKIRETLTRIGVASRKDKTLFQSCHILHKQGRNFDLWESYENDVIWHNDECNFIFTQTFL